MFILLYHAPIFAQIVSGPCFAQLRLDGPWVRWSYSLTVRNIWNPKCLAKFLHSDLEKMMEILSQARHIHDAYSYKTFGLSSCCVLFKTAWVAWTNCSRCKHLNIRNMNWINAMLISVRGVADEYNHNWFGTWQINVCGLLLPFFLSPQMHNKEILIHEPSYTL